MTTTYRYRLGVNENGNGGQWMSTNETQRTVRVVCTECGFSEVVEKGGEKPAEVIVEHGRKTGHKLRTEEVEPTQ